MARLVGLKGKSGAKPARSRRRKRRIIFNDATGKLGRLDMVKTLEPEDLLLRKAIIILRETESA